MEDNKEEEMAETERKGSFDAFDLLENILVKVFTSKYKNPLTDFDSLLRSLQYPQKPHEDLPDDVLEKRKKSCENHLTILSQPKDDEGNLKPLCSVPNFLEEAALFEAAGYGFGQLNYTIVCKLRQLAGNTEGLKKVRLWGKILGSQKDYWVAEGLLDGTGEATEDPLFEPQGTGANLYSYWVTDDLINGKWKKLPDVEPRHIRLSRTIDKLLSGNIDASITSEIYFPGTERHYLRATIARITADTVLAPKGYLEVSEEGGGIKEAENFVFPSSPSELLKPSQWVHINDYILQNGRTAYPEVDGEAEDGEAKQKELADQIAVDPPQEVLRGINPAHWALKANESSGVAHAHSLKWPGSVTVVKGTAFASMYVGYGRKNTCKGIRSIHVRPSEV